MFGCAPIVVEEDMQKHVSAMNKTSLEMEELLKKAMQDLDWGENPENVRGKYGNNAKEKFQEMNNKLDDYVKYCDQQHLPDEIMDKYFEKVDLSKVQKLVSDLKERGVEFDFE